MSKRREPTMAHIKDPGDPFDYTHEDDPRVKAELEGADDREGGGDPFEDENTSAVERAWRDAGKVGNRRAAVEAAEAYPATTGNSQADRAVAGAAWQLNPICPTVYRRTLDQQVAEELAELSALAMRINARIKGLKQIARSIDRLQGQGLLPAVDSGETA